MAGKVVLVFSPVQKGWGSSTFALSLAAALECSGTGRTILLDIYDDVSSCEFYTRNDTAKRAEGEIGDVFVKWRRNESLIPFSKKLSEYTYILPIKAIDFFGKEDKSEQFNSYIETASSFFDILILRVDGKHAKRYSSLAKASYSVVSGSFEYRKEVLERKNMHWLRKMTESQDIKTIHNCGDKLDDSISGFLPYCERLNHAASKHQEAYKVLREELMARDSIFSSNIGEIAADLLVDLGMKNKSLEVRENPLKFKFANLFRKGN